MGEWMQKDAQYIVQTYRRFPVEIRSGNGSEAFDTEGKRYIDMGSGIGVTCFGMADKAWCRAVEQQLHLVQHTSNLYYTQPCTELAQKLCQRTGMKKVFFCNSGAEANECAIKVARKYAAERKGTEYSTIVTLCNSFHGRTLTTLAATGQDHYHELFTPLTPGFVHAPANDIDAMRSLILEHKIAAILIECIQGEGGVNVLDADYVKKLEQLARENDILLMIDEVQTGNGRTGALYAYMNYGITPDVVTTAKGLGGGLPLGAAMLSEKVEQVLGYGDHGSTFGANPVCCAGALSVLDRLDDAFLREVRRKGDLARELLTGTAGVEYVCGMGLMIGIKTVRPAAEIVAECHRRGVLCLTAKDKVRLLPALNIPDSLLIEAIDIIKSVCKEEQ